MGKLSQRQKLKLISFMESHEFLVGSGTRRAGVKDLLPSGERERYWQKLTNILNSLGDTKKSMKQWRKTWSDLKMEVKKRNAKIQQRQKIMSVDADGFSSEYVDFLNPSETVKLDEWQERILALLVPSMVEDIIQSSEAGEDHWGSDRIDVSLDMEAISVAGDQSVTEEVSVIEEVVDDFRVPEDVPIHNGFEVVSSPFNCSQSDQEIDRGNNSQQIMDSNRQDRTAEFHKPRILNLDGNVSDNFTQFKEEVLIYLTATETNNKPREVQVARLKNLLGHDGLRLYNTLHDGITTETTAYILDVLEKHCTSRPNDTAGIFSAIMRKQRPEESFEQFYMDLRKQIKQCRLENQERKLLKALLVQGVRSRELQERLLQGDLSLETMVEMCEAAELAASAEPSRRGDKVHAINGLTHSQVKSVAAAASDRKRTSSEEFSSLLEVKSKKVAALEAIAAAESKQAEAMMLAAAALQSMAVSIGRVADVFETYVPEQ